MICIGWSGIGIANISDPASQKGYLEFLINDAAQHLNNDSAFLLPAYKSPLAVLWRGQPPALHRP
jgi:hypothetical protein